MGNETQRQTHFSVSRFYYLFAESAEVVTPTIAGSYEKDTVIFLIINIRVRCVYGLSSNLVKKIKFAITAISVVGGRI